MVEIRFDKNFKKYFIDNATNREELAKKEKYWIWWFDSRNRYKGYNIAEGGEGGFTAPMSEETKCKKRQIKESGYNEFQESGFKAAKSRKLNGTEERWRENIKKSRYQILENGLTLAQNVAKKSAYIRKTTIHSNGKTGQKILAENIKKCWNNKSEEELREFSEMRSRLAKNQIENESEEVRNRRIEAIKESTKETISSYHILNDDYKRVSKEEFNKNPFWVNPTWKGFHEIIFPSGRKVLITKKHFLQKFADELEVKVDWFRNKRNNVPFKYRFKKQKHLDGMIVNFIDKKYVKQYFVESYDEYEIYTGGDKWVR